MRTEYFGLGTEGFGLGTEGFGLGMEGFGLGTRRLTFLTERFKVRIERFLSRTEKYKWCSNTHQVYEHYSNNVISLLIRATVDGSDMSNDYIMRDVQMDKGIMYGTLMLAIS